MTSWVRAWAATTAVLALGTAAHVAAGGPVAQWPVLLLFAGPTVVAARWLIGTTASIAAITSFLVSGQVALHLVLSAGHGASGHAIEHRTAAGQMAMGHMASGLTDHSAGLRRSVAPLGPALLAQWGDALAGLLANPVMVAAHGGAAVTLALLWMRGERALSTGLSLLMAPLICWLRPTGVPVPGVRDEKPVPAPWTTGVELYLARVLSRRGPPALA